TDFYDASLDAPLPNGLSGTFYVRVETNVAAPPAFEFVHTDNNQRVTGPISVTIAPAPMLVVSSVVIPTLPVLSGSSVDISWTVQNTGSADAVGPWTDELHLQQVGGTQTIALGRFDHADPLAPLQTYTRTQTFSFPHDISGFFQLVATTDSGGSVF